MIHGRHCFTTSRWRQKYPKNGERFRLDKRDLAKKTKLGILDMSTIRLRILQSRSETSWRSLRQRQKSTAILVPVEEKRCAFKNCFLHDQLRLKGICIYSQLLFCDPNLCGKGPHWFSWDYKQQTRSSEGVLNLVQSGIGAILFCPVQTHDYRTTQFHATWILFFVYHFAGIKLRLGASANRVRIVVLVRRCRVMIGCI